jgi:hypothetical protein
MIIEITNAEHNRATTLVCPYLLQALVRVIPACHIIMCLFDIPCNKVVIFYKVVAA